jgi:hypothetical protein
MITLKSAFQLELLNVNKALVSQLRPVTSIDIFDGITTNFDDNGLYSILTFGKIGSEERDSTFSYIDIKIPILHPKYFIELTKLKRLYSDIILGLEYAKFDEEQGDFVSSNLVEGETGFHFFKQHFHKLVFTRNKSVKRDKRITFLEKFRDIAYSPYVLVIPAGFRDVEIDKDGRTAVPDINKIYVSLLSVANTVGNVVDSSSGAYYDVAAINLQKKFVELYKLISSNFSGKNSTASQKWAARNVIGGTRNVLIAPLNITYDLDGKAAHDINDTHMGLFQYCKAFLPAVVYGILNGFASKIVQYGINEAKLVNPKTLRSEIAHVDDNDTDLLTNEEGIEKLINYYSYKENRQNPVMVGDYALALVYRDDKYFRVFQDITELPSYLDKRKVHLLTYTELIYISIQEKCSRGITTLTRYPITGQGSEYESYVYLRTTSVSHELIRLDENFKPIIEDGIHYVCYPVPDKDSSFFDGVSANQCHLKATGGDHDGDE